MPSPPRKLEILRSLDGTMKRQHISANVRLWSSTMEQIIVLQDLPTDILRNSLVSLLNLDTLFRVGLTSPFWREEIWNYVTSVSIVYSSQAGSLPEAAVSYLASRPMLTHVNRVKFVNTAATVPDSFAKAFASFLPSCGKSLTDVHIEEGALSKLVSDRFLTRMGRNLKSFHYYGHNQGEALKDSEIIRIAKNCPNLVSFGISHAGFAIPWISSYLRDLEELNLETQDDLTATLRAFPNLTSLNVSTTPSLLTDFRARSEPVTSQILEELIEDLRGALPRKVSLAKFSISHENVLQWILDASDAKMELHLWMRDTYGLRTPTDFTTRCQRMHRSLLRGSYSKFQYYASECEAATDAEAELCQSQIKWILLEATHGAEEDCRMLFEAMTRLIPKQYLRKISSPLLIDCCSSSGVRRLENLLNVDRQVNFGIHELIRDPSEQFLNRVLTVTMAGPDPSTERIDLLLQAGATLVPPKPIVKDNLYNLSFINMDVCLRLMDRFPDAFLASTWPIGWATSVIFSRDFRTANHQKFINHFLSPYRNTDLTDPDDPPFDLPEELQKSLVLKAITMPGCNIYALDELRERFGIERPLIHVIHRDMSPVEKHIVASIVAKLFRETTDDDMLAYHINPEIQLANLLSEKEIKEFVHVMRRRGLPQASKTLEKHL